MAQKKSSVLEGLNLSRKWGSGRSQRYALRNSAALLECVVVDAVGFGDFMDMFYPGQLGY